MQSDSGRTEPAEFQDLSHIATPAGIRRRRWFGVAMLILAVFCMVIPAVPWPTRGLFDLVTWVVFSIVLLAAGAWQLDRASREEIEAERAMRNRDPTRTGAADQ